MLHAKIGEILEEVIAGDGELEKLEGHFSEVDKKLDSMIEHKEDLEKIIEEARELTYRIFSGHRAFLDRKWPEIERGLEHNLRNYDNK